MKTTNPNTTIDRTIRSLERRKLIIEGLKNKRAAVVAKYDARISALAGADVKIVGSNQQASSQIRELPRGVLTLVIAESLKGSKKAVAVTEVIEQVKGNKLLAGATNLAAKVRNLLNTSSHFTRAERGKYKLASAPSGALFKRLKEDKTLAAA